MAFSWARIFDSRLRTARMHARQRAKDAHRLIRRGHASLSPEALAAITAALTTLEQATDKDDVAGMDAAAEPLQTLLDKHLDTYRKPAWRESAESIGVAVLVALILRSFVLEAFKIPSGSMIPSLAIGDQIFVNKYIYGLRVPFTAIRLVEFSPPKRGEVIVFICPVEPHEDYIKRIIGLPGDEIMVRNGQIHINGEAIPRQSLGQQTYWDRDGSGEHWRPFAAQTFRETLGEHTYTVLQDADASHNAPDFGPYVVPQAHVLMMGDNRDHSYDSRSWGPVPQQNILGRSLFVWWSWGREGLDTHRVGTWID